MPYLWRALIRAFGTLGHHTVFFERDVPYYAQNRDLTILEGGRLVLYDDWEEVRPEAKRELAGADAGIVTSYCPDALAATEVVLGAPALHLFYDLDTPVTLSQLAEGRAVTYIGPDGLAPFDLVLSYTGGAALTGLRDRLGAKRVAPLYGSVDPDHYRPAAPEGPRAALSYLGTYAADRRAALETLFIEPARRRPNDRFIIGGAQYPPDFPWGATCIFLAPRSCTRASEVLRLCPIDTQRDAASNGRARLVSLRAPVRGGRLRHTDRQRLVGGARRVFRA